MIKFKSLYFIFYKCGDNEAAGLQGGPNISEILSSSRLKILKTLFSILAHFMCNLREIVTSKYDFYESHKMLLLFFDHITSQNSTFG